MTLRELRAAHRHLFHPNQDWFENERFMDLRAKDEHPYGCMMVKKRRWWTDMLLLPSAADLALEYVYNRLPGEPQWRRYLWTCDKDHLGQRVYVGDNGKGLEIHRHLHLTDRWGIPVWY